MDDQGRSPLSRADAVCRSQRDGGACARGAKGQVRPRRVRRQASPRLIIYDAMTDRDDIFDEIIGADTDDLDGDEPEGSDDDTDVLDVRTALLTKNELLALISLKTTTRGSVIVRYDPRQALPVAKAYEDTDEA